MIKKILTLPLSLQVVCWIAFVSMVLQGISTVAAIASVSVNQTVIGFLGTALQYLVILSIFKKLKVIRVLVIVLSTMSLMIYGLGSVGAIFTIGFMAVALVIPTLISGLTIWGLTTKEAKEYYGIDKETLNKKRLSGICEEMHINEALELLKIDFLLESKDSVFKSEDGETLLFTFCAKDNSSRILRFEIFNDKISKIY